MESRAEIRWRHLAPALVGRRANVLCFRLIHSPVNSLTEILIIFVLLLANGVFAMAEIAIVSARKARLKALAGEGSANAHAALALAEEPTRFLSTVQIGITLVGILAGAFGGATLSEKLARWFAQFPAVEKYSDALAIFVVVSAITYFSLIRARRRACSTSRSVRWSKGCSASMRCPSPAS